MVVKVWNRSVVGISAVWMLFGCLGLRRCYGDGSGIHLCRFCRVQKEVIDFIRGCLNCLKNFASCFGFVLVFCLDCI